MSRACAPCVIALNRVSRVRVSSRSSSMVSNSLAIWANSSSSSGSSISLTELTVTEISASSPAWSPCAIGAVKVAVPPASVPATASSRPSIRSPEPTLCDTLRCARPSIGLAARGRGEVERHVVAVLRRPLDALERAEPLAQRVEFLRDLVVGHVDVVDGDRDAVQVRDGDLGTDVDLGGEAQRLGLRERRDVAGHLELGLAQRAHVLLAHGLHVLARDGVLERLRDDRAAADALVDDAGRNLARTEAGHPDLLARPPCRPCRATGLSSS